MLSRAILLLIFAFLIPLQAEEAKLKVGVFSCPPFAMKDADGHWRGLSVDLWESVSGQMGLAYEYQEVPADQLIGKLHRGELDLSLGEIGVSSEREKLVDFTQPYIVTSAAVALPRGNILASLRQVISSLSGDGVVTVIFSMLATLFVFSLLLWLIERGVHQTHFGGKPIHGFGSALWFAAVTMTTVGYGDKTPQTPLGRALAFIWMFLGILLVSAFTGSVASSITVAEMNRNLSSIHALTSFRNGAVAGSLSSTSLRTAGIPVREYPSIEGGMAALESGQITAFVGNDVALRYVVRRDAPGEVRVATLPTMHVTFAMACRPHFPLLQDLNVAIIDEINSLDWQHQVERWLGPSGAQ